MKQTIQTRIHFRRCHMCGHVNSGHQALVERCNKCSKFLASYYFFDEYKAIGIENPYHSQMVQRTTTSLPLAEYPPLTGITVYWED